MWDTFAKIAVAKEHEVEASEYFKSYANLSWAMTKANYDGQDFWSFIERLFTTELERTKLEEQPRELNASVLATICFALKDSNTRLLSNDFWHELNQSLHRFLSEGNQSAAQGRPKDDEETRDRKSVV